MGVWTVASSRPRPRFELRAGVTVETPVRRREVTDDVTMQIAAADAEVTGGGLWRHRLARVSVRTARGVDAGSTGDDTARQPRDEEGEGDTGHTCEASAAVSPPSLLDPGSPTHLLALSSSDDDATMGPRSTSRDGCSLFPH
jgi:hypothetical protein